MLRTCLLTIATIIVTLNCANTKKLCGPVQIRNNISIFEKQIRNCTVVVSIQLYLIERASVDEFDKLSFPELNEILEFFVVYRITHLKSFGKIFPNLTAIRGKKLFLGYAFIVYGLNNLTELGLTKLTEIGGQVRIYQCEKLCFADKVNWTQLGVPLMVDDDANAGTRNGTCPTCPAECPNNCWNAHTCAENELCDKECIRCTGDGPDKCVVCKNFQHEDRCVEKCPSGLIPRPLLGDCVRRNECKPLNLKKLEGMWFIFNNTCLNECPKNFKNVSAVEGYCKDCNGPCEKICNSTTIDTLRYIFNMEGCTHINGSLSIRFQTEDPIPEAFLIKYFGDIQVIDGYLEIHRSNHLKSLRFLKSLRVIKGNVTRYKGNSLVIAHNMALESLWGDDLQLKILNGQYLIQDNPQLCPKEIERFIRRTKVTDILPNNVYNNGKQKVCDTVNLNVTIVDRGPTSVTLRWDEYNIGNNNNSIVVYLITYVEKGANKIVWDDTCKESGIHTLAVQAQVQATITNLKPFTEYVYYIKILTSQNSSEENLNNQGTAESSFKTLSGDPSKPSDVNAKAVSHDVIELLWKPPKEINGELSHYELTVYPQPANLTLTEQRNYCDEKGPIEEPKLNDNYHHMHADIEDKFNSEPTCPPCPNKNEIQQEDVKVELFDELCNTPTKISCKKYTYRNHFDKTEASNISFSYVNESKFKVLEYNVSANLTRFNITNLQHFTLYTIYFSACNKKIAEKPQCSEYIMEYAKTQKKKDADDIRRFQIRSLKDNEVELSWEKPLNPNPFVTTYIVEYKLDDSEHIISTQCVPGKTREKNTIIYTMRNLLSGQYKVRVTAVTLAGRGRSSTFLEFSIASDTENTVRTIAITTALLLIILMGVAYWRYRRYKQMKRDILHTIVNPDYSEDISCDEEWEMDRADVDISNELGQGSFGMVYGGYIKSRNMPCAVKTVSETASRRERVEFLNEAHVMKSFSEAYHVVKLLGIVSKGKQPLVVMELMERGDLKSFLRRSRDSMNNITCPEMYRMAAEIADGMYYLSAMKYVHRDLAARNCMVAGDHTVKIGDFGMARDIYENDYYKKETSGLLPVRWMAPESLADGLFTTNSDVWSYGIVLWEMVTLAEQPYQGLSNEQVLQFVTNHGTLLRPQECPELLWEIMQACWKWKDTSRPTFGDIVARFETHVGPNFTAVSFFHSRAGEEHRLNASERVNSASAQSTVPEFDSAHWSVSDDDDVSLYSESNRPPRYLSYPYQRQNRTSNRYNLHNSPTFDYN